MKIIVDYCADEGIRNEEPWIAPVFAQTCGLILVENLRQRDLSTNF